MTILGRAQRLRGLVGFSMEADFEPRGARIRGWFQRASLQALQRTGRLSVLLSHSLPHRSHRQAHRTTSIRLIIRHPSANLFTEFHSTLLTCTIKCS